MKPTPKFLTLLAAASFTVTAASFAAPPAPQTSGTVDVKTGSTALQFSQDFSAALTAGSFTLQKIIPGKINPGKGELSFPIAGGALDLADLEGEFTHSGGFTVVKGDVQVSLTDFVLSTPATAETLPTLSALVVVNGSLQGRVNLFSVNLAGVTAPFSLPSNKKIVVKDAALTLSADGAAALNTAFTGETFTAGTVIGKATLTAITVKGSL